jgi:uncharacterized protein (TIGR02594 family)
MEPAWLTEARKHLGLHEQKGAQHAAEILQMWRDIKRGGIKDDETPWCAAFVGACLERAGIDSTRFESAKSYLDWGVKLDRPTVGCIAVISRPGGDHVFFVLARDAGGDIVGLGGNQSDAVSIATFDRTRVRGYRWPVGQPLPETHALPAMTAAVSTREA